MVVNVDAVLVDAVLAVVDGLPDGPFVVTEDSGEVLGVVESTAVVDVDNEGSSDSGTVSGIVTTMVGRIDSPATAAMVVGITVTGWITRFRTCETAAHDNASAATTETLHRATNLIDFGMHPLSPEPSSGSLRRQLGKPQVAPNPARAHLG